MEERTIDSDGVRITTQAFGHLDDPPILLIAGALASMTWWPDAFAERLAAGGRYVIRYDNRDIAAPSVSTPETIGHTLADMARDALAVLSGYNLLAGHLVGLGMGGVIAQLAALARPHRVRTLTLIGSTPLGIEWLPPPSEAYRRHMATLDQLDWNDREQVADFLMRDARAVAGTRHPHDAEAARRRVEAQLHRSPSFQGLRNDLAVRAPRVPAARAAGIQAPALIVHGTADPVFPIAHAEVMAEAIRGSRLVRIEGGGHELHPADLSQIADEILLHTALIQVGRL